VIAPDAFRDAGFLFAAVPDPDGPQECVDARAVAVTGDANLGRSLSAARPDNPDACTDLPVQIRLNISVSAIQIVVAGDAVRQLDVFYKDNTRVTENDLTVTAEERRGEIDFLVVRGVPAAAGGEAPAVQIREIRFIPSQ
jgi:hypothetical protein